MPTIEQMKDRMNYYRTKSVQLSRIEYSPHIMNGDNGGVNRRLVFEKSEDDEIPRVSIETFRQARILIPEKSVLFSF